MIRTIQRHYDGCVSRMVRAHFCAVLTDRVGKEPDLAARFALSEVPARDRPLVTAGAIFQWLIFRITFPSGQEWQCSEIRFSRRRWTAKQVAKAKREAKRMAKELGR